MNDVIENNTGDLSSLSGSMVQQLVKAEIDQQISTAHAYPRSIQRVNQKVVSLATLNNETAEECTFALPRGGKPITGPSIRLAEIVVSQWGNCRVGARVVHVDRKEMYVEAEGIFHDLETNTATTDRVRRRISDRNDRIFSDDMIIVTGNAACSIAKRNAILSGVPKAIWGGAYEQCLKTLRGDSRTMAERRENALKQMAAYGVTAEQVWQILGIGGERDFDLDNMVTLGATLAALKNEETTVEELLKTANAATDNKPSGGSVTNKRKSPDSEPTKKADPKPKDDVIEDEKPQKEPEPKAEPKETKEPEKKAEPEPQKEPEPSQEEVEPEKPDTKEEPKASGQKGPDRSAFEILYDTIINDLMDAGEPDDVVDMYADQIAKMEEHFPDLHGRLQEEIAAAKE